MSFCSAMDTIGSLRPLNIIAATSQSGGPRSTPAYFRQPLTFLALLPALLTPPAVGVQSPSRVREVIVVFKTHFDIGYTDTAGNVLERYRTKMIDLALEAVDRNDDLPPEEQFVWTIPGWPMKEILADRPGQTAKRKERILEAFRNGRFVVHALPFTTHTETLELEDLVRGLGAASQVSREAGRALPRDAKMTDVPSHSWVMPTLLKHAGVDFLHLGCNMASSSPEVPVLFWWQGPDGSRLLTMYSAAGYGTGLAPPEDWPYRTWLALIHTGDNHGPPAPDEVRRLLEEAKQRLPAVKVRIGRLSDFSDAILAEKPDLRVVRADMPDTWIHGPIADPAGAKIARNVRPLIMADEALVTQLHAWGATVPDASPLIAAAYEQSLLYGEHTWGGAFWWIYGRYELKFGDQWQQERAAGRFRRIESSWDDHTAYIESARKMIEPALETHLEALARRISAAGRRVVVYNPLPWKRNGVVSVNLNGPGVDALETAGTGEIVPVGADGNTLRFVARDVPPMGYRTYLPAESRGSTTGMNRSLQTAETNVLESRSFRITVDPARGVVVSVIAKQSGRELVDAGAAQGFGQYLYERFDRDQVQAYVRAYVKITDEWGINELGKPSLPPAGQVPYRAASPRNFQFRLEESPVAATVVMQARPGDGLPHAVTTRVVLYRDLPYMDLEITLHDKPFDAWPEAGWICLPFKVESPRFRLGRLGSIVDPAADLVPGSNHDMFWLNTGLTVTDQRGRGAGLCPIDHPLVSLGEPGCWKYSRYLSTRRPVVYVNLFNNQWSTNFRLWNGGTWTSRVRIWAVDSGQAGTDLVTTSEDARLPLQAALVDGRAGNLPASQPGLELSRGGVLVTAFGSNPDGRGTVLRLWENAGTSGDCRVRLPKGINAHSVQPVDLRGRPAGKPIMVEDGVFVFPLPAFAPASFVIAPKE